MVVPKARDGGDLGLSPVSGESWTDSSYSLELVVACFTERLRDSEACPVSSGWEQWAQRHKERTGGWRTGDQRG